MTKQNEKDAKRVPELRFKGFTDDWEQRKLGEEFQHINERNDGSFDNTRYISVANMYFKDPNEVQSNNILTRTYVMRRDDIAFEGHPSKKYKFGRFVANDIGDGVVSELFPVYRHVSKYDAKYWKYAIQIESIMAPLFAKSITSSGNSSNKLNPKHFLRQMVNVPDLNEQIKIGEFLSKFDAIITLHEEKQRQLERLKKALLQKMFADKTGYPALRFKGFTEKWEQRKLGEIATIVGGGTPSTKNPEYWDGDINWYSPAEIGNQIYTEKSERQITELGLKKSSAKLLPVGTVLFTSRAGIGKTAILNKEACTNQGFQSIIPRSKMLNSYFLFSRTNSLKQYGETMGSGSTFVEVSGKQMSKMPLFIPNINEQSKIAKLFQSLDRTITLHDKKIQYLKQLKRGLLQKMFV